MNEQSVIWVLAFWYTLSVSAVLIWLWRTHRGKQAFESAPPRWHLIEITDILFLVLLYLVMQSVPLAVLGKEQARRLGLPALLLVFAGQVVLTTAVMVLARRRFAEGLRGFGIRLERFWRNLGVALAGFVLGTGLVLLVLAVITYLIPDEIPQHELLRELREQPGSSVSLLIMLTAVVGASLMEETLFRGIIQTFLAGRIGGKQEMMPQTSGQADTSAPLEQWSVRRWIGDPSMKARWLAIAVTAALWAAVHPNWQHMPALFVLGLLLGYLYERYGNLLVPIAVHALFNLLQVTMTIVQANQPQ
jgi:membrane protease YdiL (CAAX protease family)